MKLMTIAEFLLTREDFRFWGKTKYSGKREFILGVWGVGVSPFSINIVRFRYKLTVFIANFCNHSSNISKIFSFPIPIPLSRTGNETGENEMPKFMEILY